jgi:hypothetical protein
MSRKEWQNFKHTFLNSNVSKMLYLVAKKIKKDWRMKFFNRGVDDLTARCEVVGIIWNRCWRE